MNLLELAKSLDGTLIGDGSLDFNTVKALDNARAGDLSYVLEKGYLKTAKVSEASAFVTFTKIEELPAQIIVKNPRKALAQLINLFLKKTLPKSSSECIHPSATIGEGTVVMSNVVIGANASIGKNCLLYPNVTILDDVEIGDNVIVHSGAVIGADGFGYYNEGGKWFKIAQVGSVIIGDDVEIGANTTIDRGCIGNTVIDSGTKIDNLVHIAHNIHIGSDCAIASQVGFTGGCILKNRVMVGGQAGFDKAIVEDDTIVAARAGVTKNVRGMVSGFPAWNHRSELQKEAFIRQLSKKKDSK